MFFETRESNLAHDFQILLRHKLYITEVCIYKVKCKFQFRAMVPDNISLYSWQRAHSKQKKSVRQSVKQLPSISFAFLT